MTKPLAEMSDEERSDYILDLDDVLDENVADVSISEHRITRRLAQLRAADRKAERVATLLDAEALLRDRGCWREAKPVIDHLYLLVLSKESAMRPPSRLAQLRAADRRAGMDIEEKAKDIIKNVDKLGKHIAKYDDYYSKLGNSLSTTVNHYNAGYKELGKIDKDVLRITEESPGIEAEQIEKPVAD